MPLYSLKCPKCNHTDDYFVRITKDVEDKHYCPKCFMRLQSVILERDYNPSKVNIVLKGSDRYRDRHADDKKVKSEFEQRWNKMLDDNVKFKKEADDEVERWENDEDEDI